jgi:hypothetical protein
MTSQQFTEWLAYDQLEPFGELRADFRVAQLTSITANVNRDRERRPEPFIPLDFMPYAEQPELEPEELSPEELSLQIKSELFGKKD